MIDNSQYLVHHGIKGQKWGIRRYQNEDGTLTAAGRARLQDYKRSAKSDAEKRYTKEEHRAYRTTKNDPGTRKALLKEIAERKKKEIDAINNTKLSDIKEENSAARKAVATSLGIGVGTLGALAGLELGALSAGMLVVGLAPLAIAGAGIGMIAAAPSAGKSAKIESRLNRGKK